MASRATASWTLDVLRRKGPSEAQRDEASAFVAILRSCARNKDLCRGTRVHDNILRGRGLLGECSDALITMYAKCGELAKASELFDTHKSRDVRTWTALISGYAQQGQGHVALTYYNQMQREGLYPDAVTYTCILKACGSIGAVNKGKEIHDEIASQGLLMSNLVVGTAVVDMYVKCGVLAKAQQILEELPGRDVVSWNALIAGYTQQAEGEQALDCVEKMKLEGLSPNAVTYLSIVKACGSIKAAEKGRSIHDQINKQGLLQKNPMLGNALVDMYAKCGDLSKARQVLEELPVRDAISWNTLTAGYAQQGDGEQALQCFEGMRHEGHFPDVVTFTSLLQACASIGATDMGEKIHYEIAKQGLLKKNIVVATALVDMYARCGALAKASKLLKEISVQTVTSWNALIAGYVQQREGAQAIDCFEGMQREGLSPDMVSFVCVLKACGSIGAVDKGEKVHVEVAKQGLLGKDVVLGTALVDMYVRCGDLAKARQVLEELPARNVVSWTALIAGYAQQGEGAEALNCLEQMQRDGISPNEMTFSCILKACGSIGAIDKGEKFHDEIAKQGLLGSNVVLGTALVDMYAKCGALAKAQCLLDQLPARNVISWNALITGYAQQCEGAEVLKCLERMQQDGLFPDAATLSCVLSACSRLGLVDDAELYFLSMSTKLGLKPDVEHYACMVDLFGRSGHLDKAAGVLERMVSSHIGVWSALLGACQKWGDVDVARWAFEHAVQVDKTDALIYLIMGDIYAAAGMHEDASRIEAMRIENKAWEEPTETDRLEDA